MSNTSPGPSFVLCKTARYLLIVFSFLLLSLAPRAVFGQG